MTHIIQFDQVSKEFNGKNVVDNVSLTIEEGEFFVIVGPSGSGKTTLLKMINALHVPTQGDIYLHDKKIKDYDIQKLRWKIGYVLQQIALFPTMTVEENIDVIPDMIGWKKSKRRQAIKTLLEEVQLDPATYASRLPKELSGGEQQRVGILRAIAAEPDVILMDEPFSALDPISRTQLQSLIIELHEKLKNTIVFVTHDMNEAMKLGDRIAVMKEGRLIQCATPEEIEQHPADAFVAEFFQHANGTSKPKVSDAISNLTLLPVGQHYTGKTIESSDCLSNAFALLSTEGKIGITRNGHVIGLIDAKLLMGYLSQHP